MRAKEDERRKRGMSKKAKKRGQEGKIREKERRKERET